MLKTACVNIHNKNIAGCHLYDILFYKYQLEQHEKVLTQTTSVGLQVQPKLMFSYMQTVYTLPLVLMFFCL